MRDGGMEPGRWMRASVLTGAVLALLLPIPLRMELNPFAAASDSQAGSAPAHARVPSDRQQSKEKNPLPEDSGRGLVGGSRPLIPSSDGAAVRGG
jgi:hypothetical protein